MTVLLPVIYLIIGLVFFVPKTYSNSQYPFTSVQIANLPPSTKQVIVVSPTSGVGAEVTAFQKHHAQWIKSFSSFPAVIGRAGVAKLGEKVEGDKKTPAGIYSLSSAFGSKTLKLKLDYRHTTVSDKFIDDPKSPDYNQWVSGETSAKSYEPMLRQDGIYNIGVVIDYNMHPVVVGKGSAIFMHIWYGSSTGTAGCVAMSEKNLRKLTFWLNKRDQPYILIKEAK